MAVALGAPGGGAFFPSRPPMRRLLLPRATDTCRAMMSQARRTVPRRTEERSVFLACRVPKSLHHALKVHCVENQMQLMDFVIRALEERLAKESRKPRAPTRR